MFKSPGTISKVGTLADGSIRLTIDTPELSAESCAMLFSLARMEGTFGFSESDIEKLEPPDESINEDKKSASQRLREIMWVYYKKKNGNDERFGKFRDDYMEKLILNWKEKVSELPE